LAKKGFDVKDFQLGFVLPIAPLGRLLTSRRTEAYRAVLRDIYKQHNARRDFENLCHDIPETMAGKAKAEPAVAPAVDVRPAALRPRIAPIGTPTGVYDDEATGDRYYIFKDGGDSVMRKAQGFLGDFGKFARPPWLPAQREQVQP
jgi:hypothetical protein